MPLPTSVIERYHRELTDTIAKHGIDIFRIGGGEELPYRRLNVCCGGPTKSRIAGFTQLANALASDAAGADVGMGDATTLKISVSDNGADGEIHLRNSLIGYMHAQVVILFFSSKSDYTEWVEDGVEADFLRLTQPVNADKHFVVLCEQRLPLEDIKSLTGAWQVSTDIDLPTELGLRGEYVDPGFGGMVLIPSGAYEWTSIGRPFLMSQAEVTQDLYAHTMGNNPSYFRGAERPVEQVSWFGMLHLANVLSGADACYKRIGSGIQGSADWIEGCRGFRLPTEQEWEYACRAFSPYMYSGGDSPADAAWYVRNSENQTHPVGQHKMNAFGTYDMSGNVGEWCWDLYTKGGTYRVLRGGAWSYFAGSIRADYRLYDAPAFQSRNGGGRLSRSLP